MSRVIKHFKIEVWFKNYAGYEPSPARGFSTDARLPVEDGFVFLSDIKQLNGFGFPLDHVHHYEITAVYRESDNATSDTASLP
ncbi:hypothetical protein [Yersinia hibernica]|uniref:hypothetical protein n=1 Tax=Yersinia hibernica TaxID=2339259 RepID=UPI0015815093|nr:hypothetical protein [Yersinia hibernica]